MNTGERDELIFKIAMVKKRDDHQTLFGIPITSVGFQYREYLPCPEDVYLVQLRGMSDNQLEKLAYRMRIEKAPGGAKADIYINGEGVSLKSLRAAPAALVNHTSRPGFEFACANARTSIQTLDTIIDDYWEKRMHGIISEDTRITDRNCPFREHKEYLRPILEYFLFDGTGSRLSTAPANCIIEFSDPLAENSYRRLSKADAVDSVWPHLIFSLRAKKGMPLNYSPDTYRGKNAASIRRWVRYHSGDYRGALHIRTN